MEKSFQFSSREGSTSYTPQGPATETDVLLAAANERPYAVIPETLVQSNPTEPTILEATDKMTGAYGRRMVDGGENPGPKDFSTPHN